MTSTSHFVILTISVCLLVSALAKSANPEEMESLQASLEQDPEVHTDNKVSNNHLCNNF